MFDVVVISGDVGMRKPEPEIFLHTAKLLGVPPPRSVFVDDLRRNIEAAEGLGFVAIHHTDYETTAAQLTELFGIDLA
jgi:HAD superfamily hydrolase (TIGR01509 family)